MKILVHEMLFSEITLLFKMLPAIDLLSFRQGQQIDKDEYAALMEYY